MPDVDTDVHQVEDNSQPNSHTDGPWQVVADSQASPCPLDQAEAIAPLAPSCTPVLVLPAAFSPHIQAEVAPGSESHTGSGSTRHTPESDPIQTTERETALGMPENPDSPIEPVPTAFQSRVIDGGLAIPIDLATVPPSRLELLPSCFREESWEFRHGLSEQIDAADGITGTLYPLMRWPGSERDTFVAWLTDAHTRWSFSNRAVQNLRFRSRPDAEPADLLTALLAVEPPNRTLPGLTDYAHMLMRTARQLGIGVPGMMPSVVDPAAAAPAIAGRLRELGLAATSPTIRKGLRITHSDPADRKPADTVDPAVLAAEVLSADRRDEVYTMRFWNGTHWKWKNGAYHELPTHEVQSAAVGRLNSGYAWVTTGVAANVLMHIEARTLLPASVKAPAWLPGENIPLRAPLLDQTGQPVLDASGSPQMADNPMAIGVDLQRQETLRVVSAEWNPSNVLVTPTELLLLPTAEEVRAVTDSVEPAGVVDLKLRRIPATPRLFSTFALDYEFDDQAPEPALWLQFLIQLWPDDQDSINLLQEWFGLCLTPDISNQKIMLFIGPTRSGKGTISRLLSGVIGAENCAGPPLASLAAQFGLQPLIGKPCAIVTDARLSNDPRAQATIVERLLSISGEDRITIDRKHKTAVTMTLPTRFTIVSNELPRLHDSSGALVDRFLLLRFVTSFLGREDTELTKKLLLERPSILRWALIGRARLLQRGRFVQPASGQEVIDQLRELSSPIGKFVRDLCDVGPDCSADKLLLYNAYVLWCEAEGRPPASQSVFGRDLLAAIPTLSEHRPRAGDGQRHRVYAGLRLRPLGSPSPMVPPMPPAA